MKHCDILLNGWHDNACFICRYFLLYIHIKRANKFIRKTHATKFKVCIRDIYLNIPSHNYIWQRTTLLKVLNINNDTFYCFSTSFVIPSSLRSILYMCIYTHTTRYLLIRIECGRRFANVVGWPITHQLNIWRAYLTALLIFFLERNFSGLFEIITLYVCLCNVKDIRVFNFDDLSVSSLWWLHIRMICECKR